MRCYALVCVFWMFQTTVFAGIFEEQVRWDKQRLKVCFYDNVEQLKIINFAYGTDLETVEKQGFMPEFFDSSEKATIRRMVNLNYTYVNTGIHFIGWKNCSRSPEADVVIMKAGKIPRRFWFGKKPKFLGQSTIGQNGFLGEDGGFRKGPKNFKSTVLLSVMHPMTIVHEFGHLAGLRHEHIRPEAKIDSSCYYRERRMFGEGKIRSYIIPEPIGPTAVLYSRYDSKSIMSYCIINNPGFNRNLTTYDLLSTEDKETLKFYYDQ